MAFESKAVANHLLDLAKCDGQSLSPMRVIKLAYIAHGWHLALTGSMLVDEYPEAWQYGPVIPSIYHEFKHFGNSPVTTPALRLDLRSRTLVPYRLPTTTDAESARVVLDRIWEVYKPFDALQLSAMTHKEGTPWFITWHEKGGKDVRGKDIDTKLIKDHYEQLARRHRERRTATA
ncbi:MAG: DUF4065 domain-containing protein [Planctomycetes bacterium]|nr:DUF4065 domain-containing protein [Planctomycetota bacterium]